MAVLSPERRSFVRAVRDFTASDRAVAPRRDGASASEEEPARELNRRIAELGWSGVALPERDGGAGGGVTDACLLLEELAYGRQPVFGLGISMIVATTVARFGTEQQRQEMVGGFCRGEVYAVAMSEPDAGSDVASLRCRAERVAGGYRINGQKTWISCAHYADRILLVCRTDSAGPKHAGLTMLAVPIASEGLDIRPIDTLGGQEVNEVYFTDVVVPEEALIGSEGGAWEQLTSGLNFERLVCAAIFLGHARRAFDDTVEYVQSRHQFGRPVGSFQVLRHRLADLATELECCRLLVYDVARRVDAEPDRQFPAEASMAKLKITETAKRISIEGMQMMGAAGYSTEYPMEGHLRGNIISTVFAGTSEVQRGIIAGSLGV